MGSGGSFWSSRAASAAGVGASSSSVRKVILTPNFRPRAVPAWVKKSESKPRSRNVVPGAIFAVGMPDCSDSSAVSSAK